MRKREDLHEAEGGAADGEHFAADILAPPPRGLVQRRGPPPPSECEQLGFPERQHFEADVVKTARGGPMQRRPPVARLLERRKSGLEVSGF